MNGLRFFTVLFLPSMISAQTIINNTLYEDQFACPGTEVVFTCELRGSQNLILSWTSVEVIGPGSAQIQFAAQSAQDTPRVRRNSSSNPTTFAILIINDNVAMRLVSELHVTVPSNISDVSVTCNNVVNSTSTTKPFTVLGQPNVPRDIVFASQQECRLREDVNPIRCQNTYYWCYSPVNTTQAGVNDYNIFINGDLESKRTLNITTNTCTAGVRVSSIFNTTSCDAHMFSVGAINVCGCRGERSSDRRFNPEERGTLSVEDCVPSGAAYQDCTLTILLMAVITAINSCLNG